MKECTITISEREKTMIYVALSCYESMIIKKFTNTDVALSDVVDVVKEVNTLRGKISSEEWEE